MAALPSLRATPLALLLLVVCAMCLGTAQCGTTATNGASLKGALPEVAGESSPLNGQVIAGEGPDPLDNDHVHIASAPDLKQLPDLVKSMGYPLEEHHVTTADGYILTMFRIPHSRFEQKHTPRPAVFLQHGLLDNFEAWVVNGREESLGCMLADAGYDVYMGNNRGNSYSLGHLTMNIEDKKYWQFTWDEMAEFDLPANIDAALQISGHKTLSYVGHSQGTTQAFAGFSNNPELSKKVNLFIALAPVTYLSHQTSVLLSLLAKMGVSKMLTTLGFKQFLPAMKELQWLFPNICKAVPFGCETVLFSLCGANYANLNDTRIELYTRFLPAGTSMQNMEHWVQSVNVERYQKFDFGCGWLSCKNKEVYGQKTPPQYMLNKVTVPTALFYGGKDDLGNPTDVEQHLMKELPASTIVHVDFRHEYEHLDFTWGMNANKLIYPKAIELIAKYNPKNE